MTKESFLVLVAGGGQDPNLLCLIQTLKARGVDYLFLETAAEHPWIVWDLEGDTLVVDGRRIQPAAAFVRHDVFSHLADPRPSVSLRAFAWYTAATGWIAAHPEIRFFNRASMHAGTNKAYVLHLAKSLGFSIPKTLITNHLGYASSYLEDRPKIVKPINGGGYCQHLDQVIKQTQVQKQHIAAAPAIVQPELVQPEFRVYRLGTHFMGFAMVSDSLDYRVQQDCQVKPWEEVPAELIEKLEALTDRMGLSFGAADFKTDPHSGELQFLEINSGPMFAAFDLASKGKLTNHLVDFLCQKG